MTILEQLAAYAREPVSYTHLDVYKRQIQSYTGFPMYGNSFILYKSDFSSLVSFFGLCYDDERFGIF